MSKAHPMYTRHSRLLATTARTVARHALDASWAVWRGQNLRAETIAYSVLVETQRITALRTGERLDYAIYERVSRAALTAKMLACREVVF